MDLSRRLRARKLVRASFDAGWYATAHSVPEQKAWRHYRIARSVTPTDPNPDFSASGYLEANPDVARSGVEPFVHYLLFGRDEGRPTTPSAHRPPVGARTARRQPAVTPIDAEAIAREQVAAAFDADYYQAAYGPCADDPLTGYLNDPAAWRRRPNAWFDPEHYLRMNPDVAEAGLNPLVHYVLAGSAEGRQVHAGVAARDYDAALALPDVAQSIAMWPAPASLVVTDLPKAVDRLAAGLRGQRLWLSIGNDDFLQGTGGIQIVLGEELTGVRAQGVDHLYLHPASPSPVIGARSPVVQSLVNGRRGPSLQVGDVRSALGELSRRGVVVEGIRVHGLLGWDTRALAGIVPDGCPVELVVHDMATVCGNYTLTFASRTFCGAPPIGSPACSVCAFGSTRSEIVESVRRLLDDVHPLVTFPSEAAAEQWQGTFGRREPWRVRPHGHIEWTGTRTADAPRPRLAYLGMSSELKGFDFFTDLAAWNLGSGAYDLYWLGRGQHAIPGVTNVNVDQIGGHTGSMTDALVHSGIHAALISPRGFETFSLVAHEAIAAGCYIVTHADTGNVARLVRQYDCGAVVDTPELALRLLREERFREHLRRWSRVRPIGQFHFDPVDLGALDAGGARAV